MDATIADLEAFFANAPVGFSLIDRDLRWVRVNRAMAQINGFTVEDHIGKRQDELIPQVNEIIAAAQRRVIETGTPSLGHTVVTETPAYPGVEREFEVDYFPVPDDRGGFMVGCCVYESHVSAKLLEAVRSEVRRTRQVAEGLKFFLASVSADGTLHDANSAALKIAGLESDEVRGKLFWDAGWWDHSEASRCAARDAVREAAAGKLSRLDLMTRTEGDGEILLSLQFAPLLDREGKVREIIVSGIDVTEQRRSQRQQEINYAELRHRTKNIFANVQALSQLIASHSRDLDDFRRKFDERLVALARSNEALMKNEWSDIGARELIDMEIQPYREAREAAFSIEGPSCMVRPEDAPSIGLAVHELVTNAAKYGALSTDSGTVRIEIAADPHGKLSKLSWRESGGPAFLASGRTGFGSVLLERLVPNATGMEVEIDRAEAGMSYRLYRR